MTREELLSRYNSTSTTNTKKKKYTAEELTNRYQATAQTSPVETQVTPNTTPALTQMAQGVLQATQTKQPVAQPTQTIQPTPSANNIPVTPQITPSTAAPQVQANQPASQPATQKPIPIVQPEQTMATNQPASMVMTEKLQNGGKITTKEEAIQFLKEQNVSDRDIDYGIGKIEALRSNIVPAGKMMSEQKAIAFIPANTYDKLYGQREGLAEAKKTTTVTGTQYLQDKEKLEEAEKNNDILNINKYKTIVEADKEKIREQYKDQKYEGDIIKIRKSLTPDIQELDSIKAQFEMTDDVNKKRELADRYRMLYNKVESKREAYADALAYDEAVNDNIASDIGRSFYKNVLGGTARTINSADALGQRVAGLDASTVNASSLINYIKGEGLSVSDRLKNATRQTLGSLIPGGSLVTTAQSVLSEPQMAYNQLATIHAANPNNQRLNKLFEQITNKTYQGTAEDLAKELDKIQKELYQEFKDKYTQDELDLVEEQRRHNEAIYKNNAWLPNAFGTVGDMVFPTLVGYAAGGAGELLAPASGTMNTAGSIANTARNFGLYGTIGASSGSAGLDQALANGASYNDAFNYGVLKGLTEAGTEKLGGEAVLGWFGEHGKTALGKVFGKAIDKLGIESKVGRFLGNQFSGVASEMVEEMISEAVDPLWQVITYNPDALPKNLDEIGQYFKNIFNAGIEAIPSTLIMSGSGLGMNVVRVQTVENGLIDSIQRNSELSDITKAQLINEVKKASNEVKAEINQNYGDTIEENIKGTMLNNMIENNENKANEDINKNGGDISQAVKYLDEVSVANQAKQAGVTNKNLIDTMQLIQDNRSGLTFGFDRTMDGNGAQITYPDGSRKILVNPDSPRAAEFTLAHELMHDIEGTQAHEILKEMLLNDAKAKGTYEESRNALEKTYQEHNIANYNIDNEVVADILADMLGDRTLFERMYLQNPSLFNDIRNWFEDQSKLKDLTKEQKQFRRKASQLFTEGMEQPFTRKPSEPNQNFSFIGYDEKGNPKFRSNYGEDVTLSQKLDGLLSALKELQGEHIRLNVNGRKIMASFDEYGVQKTRFGTRKGERAETTKGINAKSSLAKDLYSIINGSKFLSSSDEASYTSDVPPKNDAHKDVKKWYTFGNTINFEGELYDVLTTVREKDDGNYGYSIKFFEHKKNNLSQVYDSKNLHDNTRPSYSTNSIPQTPSNVKHSISEVEETTPTQDNQGRKLTKEQQKFFKDSKARDENGNLVEVYHGTEYNFFTFDAQANYGEGNIFFANNPRAARGFSGNANRIMSEELRQSYLERLESAETIPKILALMKEATPTISSYNLEKTSTDSKKRRQVFFSY